MPTGAMASSFSISKGFGGKVYMAPVSGITCNGLGRLMILSSNTRSALSTVGAQGGMKKSEAESFAKGIYGAIPTYSTNPSKSPIVGGQILGKENATPDLRTCYIPTPTGPVFIPVFKTTNNYNVSAR